MCWRFLGPGEDWESSRLGGKHSPLDPLDPF